MERLKILFVTNWYPTRQEPVKAIWVREHAKAAQLYDDVVVLHCAGSATRSNRLWRIESETEEDLREGIPTWRTWYWRSPVPQASYLFYFASIIASCRHLANGGFKPDLIHVHVYDAGAPAVAFARLHRIPVIVSEHFSSFPRRMLNRLDVCKAWLAFRWADVVVSPSNFLKNAIEQYGLQARFEIIPHAVDTELFFPNLGTRITTFVPKRILFVGQLEPTRGLADLLRALSLLSRKRNDWHLDVVGNGSSRSKYEELAAELQLGDKVAFLGLKTKREVAELMRQSDLFVLPSLAETFSVPAAEALACGLPVLSTRCGAPEEFIVDDVGKLVAPRDPDAMFTGLDWMLDNLHRYSRDRVAQYARERYSSRVVGEKLHSLYRSLVRTRVSSISAN